MYMFVLDTMESRSSMDENARNLIHFPTFTALEYTRGHFPQTVELD